VRRAGEGTRRGRHGWRIFFGLLGFVALVALWEAYKAIDGKVLGWQLPLKADDQRMPHVWTMVQRLNDPENRGTSRTVAGAVLAGSWYTFRMALAGLLVGVAIGLFLAIVMQRFHVVERGLMPYVVMSQTIPIVAFAPLIGAWGGRIELWGVRWQGWMSVATIAAFLSFAPIAVGMLRGLYAPSPQSLELMRSLAAPNRATLWKLRFPASVPFLIPALRLAAAGAVVGAIVAEISLGRGGGIGRLILEYSREATSDPAKVYTALFGAALLGLFMAGAVALFEVIITRHRPKEPA
jgi:NitT/TauT family transport system permease protein